MTHFERLKRKRLGDLLVDEGLVSKETVLAALQEQQQTGRLLSSILLDAEEVDAYDLARIVVQQFQVPYLDLESYTVHKDLIREFSAELLHKGRLIPLDRFGPSVAFACQEIPSREVYRKIKEQVEGGIFVYISLARDIQAKLDDNHPYKGEDREAGGGLAVAGGGLPAPEALVQDKSWQSLFDAANESVMSELTDDDL